MIVLLLLGTWSLHAEFYPLMLVADVFQLYAGHESLVLSVLCHV